MIHYRIDSSVGKDLRRPARLPLHLGRISTAAVHGMSHDDAPACGFTRWAIEAPYFR